MDEKLDSENQVAVEGDFRNLLKIDPSSARFPCCIVWTPLPVISWLIPFIGHIGICREDGVILDFAGPNFVCVDNFAFGAVARYVQINVKKDCCISSDSVALRADDQHERDLHGINALTWDGALRNSTQEFQHRSYNLFTCNCHSFVANNLNRLGFHSGRWNVVNLAAFILLKGRWVSKTAALRSLLPFIIVSTLGILIGGKSFITFLAFFTSLLVGWFLLGTYCFKNLIQL